MDLEDMFSEEEPIPIIPVIIPAFSGPISVPTGPSLDARGVLRGRCKECTTCHNFKRDHNTLKCASCGHTPVKHINLSNQPTSSNNTLISSSSTPSLSTVLPSPQITTEEDIKEDMSSRSKQPFYSQLMPFNMFTRSTQELVKSEKKTESEESEEEEEGQMTVDSEDYICAVPGCNRETEYDLNTGLASDYCQEHERSRVYIPPQRPLAGRRPLTVGPLLQSGASPFVTPSGPPVSICKLQGCNRRAYVDPNTLEKFPCCGRTHALEYQRMQSSTIIDPSMKCSNPDCNRPKYQEEDGTTYDFCGKSCRNAFGGAKPKMEEFPEATPENKCMLPKCTRPCYTDPRTGTMESFCSQSHAREATKQIILELPSHSNEYNNVLKHFNKQWIKYHPIPPISSIMKISNETVKSTFNSYKSGIGSSREWYFHGTSLSCDLLGNKTICGHKKCGVCGIVQRGFDTSLIGSNIARYKRFGHGFYLAPNSSKCHDYTQGYGTYRAMILCDVAPGKKHTVKDDQTTLKGPPSGYHSVYGAHGRALNYDEIVLYNPQAINPLYVIFYTKNGIGKIAQ